MALRLRNEISSGEVDNKSGSSGSLEQIYETVKSRVNEQEGVETTAMWRTEDSTYGVDNEEKRVAIDAFLLGSEDCVEHEKVEVSAEELCSSSNVVDEEEDDIKSVRSKPGMCSPHAQSVQDIEPMGKQETSETRPPLSIACPESGNVVMQESQVEGVESEKPEAYEKESHPVTEFVVNPRLAVEKEEKSKPPQRQVTCPSSTLASQNGEPPEGRSLLKGASADHLLETDVSLSSLSNTEPDTSITKTKDGHCLDMRSFKRVPEKAERPPSQNLHENAEIRRQPQLINVSNNLHAIMLKYPEVYSALAPKAGQTPEECNSSAHYQSLVSADEL